MAEIIQFPVRPRPEPDPEAIDIDLITAVDVAIRDLRDIARALGEDGVRRQADECRRMLERAFNAAV
jgi:hypothetical protein